MRAGDRPTKPMVRIGISGWRYAPWRGQFYPPKLPQREELSFASRLMSTIEVNGSFYSLQKPSYYRAWHDATPPDFVFAVKGPRFITHMLKLRNAEIALANFLASGIFELRAKLGPFLWQFPPQLAFDAERVNEFFSLLPRNTEDAAGLAALHDARLDGRDALQPAVPLTLRHAVEVRHPSFVDPQFVALLRRHDVALVVADTAGRWPWMEDLTADFVYVRLHGDKELYASGYEDPALEKWAARIDAWHRGSQITNARTVSEIAAPACSGRDVYCYFDNDAKVHAPFDAMRLSERLRTRQ